MKFDVRDLTLAQINEMMEAIYSMQKFKKIDPNSDDAYNQVTEWAKEQWKIRESRKKFSKERT